MIIPIELSFKADKDTRLAVSTNKTIKSHDINSVEFHIFIDGLDLTDDHTAKILSIFHSSKSQVNTDCEIVDGKIIYKPNTKLISMYEDVTNYVYVYYNNQSVDVCAFKYTVDLSKIDETALKVKEMYDQSYADLLANFERTLNDYKDSLPQADSVRAEIDAILNQFNADSQAKLNQYDTDAQQVIADNQEAFNLAEGTRKTAETDRVSSESTRKTNETTRISNEDARKSAEVIRLASEADRVSAESVRVSNEAERISKDSERDSKIEEIENSIVGKRIGGYTFNGNTEVHVTNLDEETGVFTAANHGLVNGMRCAVALNLDTQLINKTSLPNPLQTGWRFIVNATQDTFQVSNSRDGEPVLFTPNPSLDTNLWHLEATNSPVTSIVLQGFSETELTIKFRVKCHIQGANVFRLTLDGIEIANNFYSEVEGFVTRDIYPSIQNYGHSNLTMFGEYKVSLSEHAMIGKLDFYRADLATASNPHSNLSYKVFKDTFWANNTNKTDAFRGVKLYLGGHMLLNGSTLEVYNG